MADAAPKAREADTPQETDASAFSGDASWTSNAVSWTSDASNNDYHAMRLTSEENNTGLPSVELVFDDVDSNQNQRLSSTELSGVINSTTSTQLQRDTAQFLQQNYDDIQEAVTGEYADGESGISRADILSYFNADSEGALPLVAEENIVDQQAEPDGADEETVESAEEGPSEEDSDDAIEEVVPSDDEDGGGGTSAANADEEATGAEDEDGTDETAADDAAAAGEDEAADDAASEEEAATECEAGGGCGGGAGAEGEGGAGEAATEEAAAEDDAAAEEEIADVQERPGVTVDKNEDGTVAAVHLTVAGADGAPQAVTLTRQADGWAVNPPGAEVPGFTQLSRNEDGTIAGDFRTNEAGDVTYDNKDGITEVLRADGSREVRNMNDYSRIREVDGQEVKDYWDGYEWRQAASVQTGENGSTVITFAAEDGKPTSVERNADSDGLKVTFASGLTYDARWRDQSMTKTDGEGNAVELFNSGVTDSEGKTVWREGTIVQATPEGYVVQFEPSAEEGAVEGAEETDQGELPAAVVIRRGTEDAPAAVQAISAEQAEAAAAAAAGQAEAAAAAAAGQAEAAAAAAAAEQLTAEQAEAAAAEAAAAEAAEAAAAQAAADAAAASAEDQDEAA